MADRKALFFGGNTSFIFTIKTDNLSTGSTISTQYKLPLIAAGVYNMNVDWGDGTDNVITTWNQAETTHTYSVAGTYQIKIKGICRGWMQNNTGDRLKFLSIQQFGKALQLTSTGGQFWGCANLTLLDVKDTPDLSFSTSLQVCFGQCISLTTVNKINEWETASLTSLTQTFLGCTNFNSNVGNWDVSNVISFGSTFQGCTNFNQNIGGWNVSNSSTFSSMFSGCTNFNNGGVDSLKTWVFRPAGGVTLANMFRDCFNFNHPLNTWDITKVNNLQQTFINCTNFNQDLSSWDTTNVTNLAETFLGATNYSNQGVSLNTWNVSNVITMAGTFRSCAYNSPLNLWNTSNVTNMSSTFKDNVVFNQNINSWNVTKVTNFTYMFQTGNLNPAFNQPLDNWVLNTTSLVDCSYMFEYAKAFNQNINLWNTSKVSNMQQMFRGANSFNQPLNLWDLTSCTSTRNMFWQNTAFNQDVSAWDVLNVSNITGTFLQASNFANGGVSLNGWDVSTKTSLLDLFRSSNYNSPLDLWNVSNVLNFGNLFNAMPFNQNIGMWNVTNATNFGGMFSTNLAFNNGGSSDINNWILNTTTSVSLSGMFIGTTSFNQPLNNWNTSKVTTIERIFNGSIFNQPLNNWNLESCTNFLGVFSNDFPFNQDISMWNVSLGTTFVDFMFGKTNLNYSTTNYDALLNGWTDRILLPSITTTFGTIKRTAASAEARALLTRTNSTKAITNAVNNGSGLIRISATAHGLTTGNKAFIYDVLGTTEANGPWIVTVVDANTIDLDGSTFTNSYTSGGTLRTGYGWTITDGGI